MLAIAASDPSGGAGIQADIKAIEASGGWPATAITCLTVQNTCGVQSACAMPADLVARQLRAILDDLEVAAVKTGVLANAAIVGATAGLLRAARPMPVVVDPVVRSTGGFVFHDAATVEALSQELAPLATLLTPNVDDVRALTGLQVEDEAGAIAAGRRLLDLGWRAVLVKGGHFGDRHATDVLVQRSDTRALAAERVPTPHAHGTGCVLSSAIATGLARGLGLEAAAVAAKRLVVESLRHPLSFGRGRGPLDPLHTLHATQERPAPPTREEVR